MRPMLHNSMNDLFLEALDDILQHGTDVGSRDGKCRELYGWAGGLSHPRITNFLCHSKRALNPEFCAGELAWYLSGSDKVGPIAAYAPQYTRFTDTEDSDRLNGAYGVRLMHGTYPAIVSAAYHFCDHPDSRRVVIPIYLQRDFNTAMSGGCNDIPCTTSIHFQVRENQLVCSVYMRSNDVWLGLPNDIHAFTSLQILLADMLGLKCGSYYHFVGSLHLYGRNALAAKDARTTAEHDIFNHSPQLGEGGKEFTDEARPFYSPTIERVWSDIRSFVTIEALLREKQIGEKESLTNPYLNDLLQVLIHKWVDGPMDNIKSSAYRKGLTNVSDRRSRSGREDNSSAAHSESGE